MVETGPYTEFNTRASDMVYGKIPKGVELTRYCKTWVSAFESMKLRLSSHLSSERLEHIGSTAVPNMVARPIIDMLLLVPDLSDIQSIYGPMDLLGWEMEPLNDQVEYLSFIKEHGGMLTHRLFLVQRDAEWGERALRLRSRLRDDSMLADAFGLLKLKAAAEIIGPVSLGCFSWAM